MRRPGRPSGSTSTPRDREDFSFGAGPHSTPLVVGDRVFTIGTNQQLFAFDKRSGKVLWSHDLIKEFNAPELLIRPVVKDGYGCSPIAFRDTIICSVGGPGQSVMAFRQSDGSGRLEERRLSDVGSSADPDRIRAAGRSSCFSRAAPITGLDPVERERCSGRIHTIPATISTAERRLWDGDNVLFVSSAYKAGSRAIQLKQEGDATLTEELWFTNRARFMFLNAFRLGDYVYGTTGDFGPAFLTALDIKTGRSAWQHRGFGRASMLHADGKTIIIDEDGDLALAKLTPEGATILSRGEDVRNHLVDGADARGDDALRARSRKNRRARSGSETMRIACPSPAHARCSAAVLMLAIAVTVFAQAPGFSGTWKLDPRRSRITADAATGRADCGGRTGNAARHATGQRHADRRKRDQRRPSALLSSASRVDDARGRRHDHDEVDVGGRHAGRRRHPCDRIGRIRAGERGVLGVT